MTQTECVFATTWTRTITTKESSHLVCQFSCHKQERDNPRSVAVRCTSHLCVVIGITEFFDTSHVQPSGPRTTLNNPPLSRTTVRAKVPKISCPKLTHSPSFCSLWSQQPPKSQLLLCSRPLTSSMFSVKRERNSILALTISWFFAKHHIFDNDCITHRCALTS